MGVKYDVIARTGSYKDRQTGEDKATWRKIGVVLETRNGFALKLETVPVVWDGFATLKPPQQRNQGSNPPSGGHSQGPPDGGPTFGSDFDGGAGPPADDFDDDIPF